MDRIFDPQRLAALRATGLLDSAAEESFDRIGRIAADFLGVPLAQINLVDDRRQFAKSCIDPTGWLSSREAPLENSFCKYTVASSAPVVIPDARADQRVSSSATVRELGLLSYIGIPLEMSDGNVFGALCVADRVPRDWTPGEIRALTDLAGAVVSEIELRQQLEARKQLEHLKDEFVSVVAHELRTPLTSIRGSLGLLATGKLGALSAQGQRMLEIAAHNTDRLVRLINDMLDLERMESGRLELSQGTADADALVSEALGVVDGSANKAGVELVGRVPEGLFLHVDRDRVVQVLVNLLSNAIKFSEPGSAVTVTAEARGDVALFQVQDRGRGIPTEQLETIFERFRQVDGSDAREKGGTGLGLPICRTIIRQHHGRIWAASEEGRGSTFLFTLPRSAEPATESATARVA